MLLHSTKTAILLIISLSLLQSCSTLGLANSDDYGRRTLGTQLDDQMIESRGISLIRSAHEELKTAHVSVTAFNGTALITGQVSSSEVKAAASSTIKGLRHVKVVHNELEIAGPTSMMARTNDSYLTAKVKSALLLDGDTQGTRTKVVTENGTVFLMGLLTRDEAQANVDKAREVFGVQKIVKVFEFIN